MSTAAVFPTALTDPRAFAIARAMLDGFDRHYRLFRPGERRGEGARFEAADWHGPAAGAGAAHRVLRPPRRRGDRSGLQTEFNAASLPMEVWQQVKLHYIGLLIKPYQPELAETFFNSVTTKILHRSYFHNDFIFVRSTVSTEHLGERGARAPADRTAPTTRPAHARRDLVPRRPQLPARPRVRGPGPRRRQPDGRRRGAARPFRMRANFQIQVLSSLFFRNKGAYIVGKVINGFTETPFALPILHGESGGLVIDAALFGEDDLQLVFSFARAYFMVQMEVPSAYVQFLSSLMPRKPRSEIYSALGLQKQGKSVFYRDLLMHMRHSSDKFRIAPGIKGMVMLVFDLPSFPYVFKVIKDFYPPPKETTRELIKSKYLLVKRHDRRRPDGRHARVQRRRLPAPSLRGRARRRAEALLPSLLEEDGDMLVIRHAYIERRMVPLNIYLQDATPAQIAQVVVEYGNAIKDLVAPTSSRRHAVEELRRDAARQGRLLRLRRDREPRRLQLPPHSRRRATRKRRCRARSGTGRPEGRLPRDLRPVPARQPAGARGLHEHHADLLDACLLARPQGAHHGGQRA
jgi:isocitrate dehydrogenase kinase/phosphatase